MPKGTRATAPQHAITRHALALIKEKQGYMPTSTLAELAQVSRTMVSAFYAGSKVPNVNEFVRLCLALELTPSEVLYVAEGRAAADERAGRRGLSPGRTNLRAVADSNTAADAEVENRQGEP